jgi:hypothetical protein
VHCALLDEKKKAAASPDDTGGMAAEYTPDRHFPLLLRFSLEAAPAE